jgi:hypothetical protein
MLLNSSRNDKYVVLIYNIKKNALKKESSEVKKPSAILHDDMKGSILQPAFHESLSAAVFFSTPPSTVLFRTPRVPATPLPSDISATSPPSAVPAARSPHQHY